jgi:hypothetical protein
MLTIPLGVVPRLMSIAMSLLSLYGFMAGAGTALSFLLLFLFSTYTRQLEQEILDAGAQNADDICLWVQVRTLELGTGCVGPRRCVEEMYLGFYLQLFCLYKLTALLVQDYAWVRPPFLYWAQKCVKSDLTRSCVSIDHGGQDDGESDLDHLLDRAVQ